MNKALEKSIYHWIMISHGEDEEFGAENCDLCKHYSTKNNGLCYDCPVNEFTGDSCEETPFEDWFNHHHECHQNEYEDMNDPYFVICDQCRILALDEVGFLYSLV
jgi:hypothetical protein